MAPAGICIYLLQFLGDAEAGVDPLSTLCVFGLIVLQEVASGEFSCYESEQRQVCRQKGTKTLYDCMVTILPLNYVLPALNHTMLVSKLQTMQCKLYLYLCNSS